MRGVRIVTWAALLVELQAARAANLRWVKASCILPPLRVF